MEVILTEEVKKLGFKGELLEVADGYARNYLLPEGMAVRATKQNRDRYERREEEITAHKEERKDEAQDKADALSTLTLTIEEEASEEGTLYGSVSPADIMEALEENGFEEITTKQIIMDKSLAELGEYTIRVSLLDSIEAEVNVEVVPT